MFDFEGVEAGKAVVVYVQDQEPATLPGRYPDVGVRPAGPPPAYLSWVRGGPEMAVRYPGVLDRPPTLRPARTAALVVYALEREDRPAPLRVPEGGS